ncbi:CopG family antitoxin [Acidiphilium sp. PA]|uniref:CopG family antitoxin n=1 Tax=Acidiphilium sp. PA TaxID=2871705 RepID=UPI00224486E4|nr:CopG family antitoxin [Acidiphilium sp. PA]MCW8306216.1 CopG family antitoxin [Acidiphilium sp. PA]
MNRPVPEVHTDNQAETVLDQDLSDLDFSQFISAHFEFEPKAAQINMRLPQALLDAAKARSSARGIPYTRYIREVLEQAVAAPGR